MRRHDQGQRAGAKAVKLLEDAGWSECSRELIRADIPGDSDSLNREFIRAGAKDCLLVASSTTLDLIHWHLSITFPSRLVAVGDTVKDGLHSFRVFSFTSMRNSSETGCEFIIYRKNWEGLSPTEEKFLEDLQTRLDQEASAIMHRFSHGELQKMSQWQWQEILAERGLPESEYIDLNHWATWDLLQKVLAHGRAREKRRSLSPRRDPPPLEDIPITRPGSIFWIRWGKDKEFFPARMAMRDEAPHGRTDHVYFFGSGKVTVLDLSRKKAWETYTTNATKHQKAIAEAREYAGI